MKKIFSVMIVVILVAIPVMVNAAFSDVPSDHWAASYITELTGKGIINGFPDGTYQPSGTLTYGQFLKLIVSASIDGVDFNLVKADVDHWAGAYLKVAENYKVVDKGTVTAARLDQPITRIEVINILSKCDISMREHSQTSVDYLSFSDISNLDIENKIMLSHAVAIGVIGGYPDGTFKPENNLTRAEVAKILSVYMSIK